MNYAPYPLAEKATAKTSSLSSLSTACHLLSRFLSPFSNSPGSLRLRAAFLSSDSSSPPSSGSMGITLPAFGPGNLTGSPPVTAFCSFLFGLPSELPFSPTPVIFPPRKEVTRFPLPRIRHFPQLHEPRPLVPLRPAILSHGSPDLSRALQATKFALTSPRCRLRLPPLPG